MHTSSKNEPPLAARFLEQILLINLCVHIVALVCTLFLLLPGIPGGSSTGVAGRTDYLAEHPWLWRLGWLPWQAAALVNVLTASALWRTPWIPRLPAAVVLLFTLLAVVPDQFGQVLWVTRGLDLAAEADRRGEFASYRQFENQAYRAVVIWGGTLYLCMALSWTWCFAAAGTWKRSLTVLSFLTWGLLALSSVALLLPQELRPGPVLVGASNAIGLTLLLLWLALVIEQVLRRARPDEKHGRMAPWRHPGRGMAGRALEVLANSRLLRAYCEWLPPLAFLSDITDVIYVNYLVEAERLEPFVPAGLELQHLGRAGRYALFTHLTYRHGHFGPRLLGPLRRLLPSPVHSNWRIYVFDPHSGMRGVYFVTNAVASTPHALAARLLSEGMPMHVFRNAAVQAGDEPGGGAAAERRCAAGIAVERMFRELYRHVGVLCLPGSRLLVAAVVRAHHAARNLVTDSAGKLRTDGRRGTFARRRRLCRRRHAVVFPCRQGRLLLRARGARSARARKRRSPTRRRPGLPGTAAREG